MCVVLSLRKKEGNRRMNFLFYSFPSHRLFPLHALAAPDALEETVALSQAVDGVVALAHGTDEAAESVDVVLSGDGAAVLIDLGDGNLDGAVVLGPDDAVGGAALARDVTGGCRLAGCAPFRRLSCARLEIQPVNLTGRRSRHGRSPS